MVRILICKIRIALAVNRDVTKYNTVRISSKLVMSSKTIKFSLSPEKLRNLKYDYLTLQRRYGNPGNINTW